MSFMDEYNALKKKRKKEETGSSENTFMEEYNKLKVQRNEQGTGFGKNMLSSSAVAPTVGKSQEKNNQEKRTWFQSGLLADGYDFGDVTKTILGTTNDISENVTSAVLDATENLIDTGAHVVGTVGGLFSDDFKEGTRKFIAKDLLKAEEMGEKLNRFLNPSGMLTSLVVGEDTEKASLLGDKADGLVQSGAHLVGSAALQMVGVPMSVTMGVNSFGSEIESAFQQDATWGEGTVSGVITTAVELLTEKIFGGIKSGGSTLDDVTIKPLIDKISKKAVRTLAKFGVDTVGEGAEEILSGLGSAIGQKLTYAKEKEWDELFSKEDAWESFVGGFVLGGGMSSINVVKAHNQGVDYVSGMTANEEAVVNKVTEDRIAELEKDGKKLKLSEKNKIQEQVKSDLAKGYISTDTIEEVLGGETYKTYKDTVDSEDALQKEFEDLGKKQNATLSEQARYSELSQQIKELQDSNYHRRNYFKSKLSQEVSDLVANDRLSESYNERARRGQAYQADVTKYDVKQQAVIQKAIDSGILNNTRRTHEFVDMVAKISADKGVPFDFADNAKLKESGFALDGKVINGCVTKDGVTVNIDSAKSLNSVVGHEITHVLEGTEVYDALKQTLFDYAKSKGEYQSRYDSLAELYKNVKDADVEAELAADLVGDYLFTDADFINNLSTNHRNVFQKIYDEIKYLYKVATAGSKEARELEKVKKAFEKAYKEGGKATAENTDTQYSLVEDQKTIDFLENQDHIVTYKAMVQIDGKLYPPMASQSRVEEEYTDKQGNKKTKTVRKLKNPSILGRWQQADERPDIAEKTYNPKRGYSSFDLLKSNGKTVPAAYNPYEHTSNIVLNDQFEEAYNRPELVTVEYHIPVSELTSGYKAEYAKDAVGQHSWKSGPVAKDLKDPRQVYLTRWSKPVRIVPDSEVAAKYKEILDGTGLSVPFNVVTPSLLSELEKAGVSIDYDGSPMYKSIQRRSAAKEAKYSLSDSDGNQLSKEQQEYFKDSKMRDENGNLKVMYHGTPNGNFTVFKDGSYFTDNKEYADRYQNPSASSISSGKAATAPKTFEVYLDIQKPFDINDAEARNIYINDYIKGGYAIGINPYLSDAEYDKIKTIDWTEGEDLRDFLIENGYDYDGLVLDEGADGGYGDEVKSRGTSYVVFSPEQVKNIDNLKPTAGPDIRFSLSESVEETKDLLAVHNLTSEQLFKSMELGGLPMPSIAVLKADSVHDEYGDVSLILPKNAIDPKANKANKIYGGDAWTPVYPRIEYKPNGAVEKRISDKYYGLAREIGYDAVRPLYNYVTDLERQLNNAGGETAMLQKLYDDTDMMNLYLQDSGKGKIDPIEKETVTRISETEAAMNQFFIDALGKEVISSVWIQKGVKPADHRKAFMEKNRTAIEETYKRYCMEEFKFTEEEAENVLVNTSERDLLTFVRNAARYIENNGVTVKTEIDSQATQNAIREAAADGYKEWVDGLFKGVEEKTGIRNNQDYYTRSGNPRGWDVLHWANTLENVVKVMKGQEETGTGSMSPYNSFASLSHKRYGSIAEVKADSDRLGKISQEEYEALGDSFAKRFAAIADSIKDPAERNQFIAVDNAAETIVDAVRTQKSKAGILNYLQKWSNGATEQTVDDIVSLVNDIANMPTGYFEAKPQRAVGFDEVGVFVIPRNADVKLKQELLNRGYSIAEYDPDVEGDRQKVVNQFEEYKFSLSNVGEVQKQYGNYNISGKDIALEAAPVATNVAAVQETVSEKESVAPVAEVTDMFPDTPMQDIEELMAEAQDLMGAMEAYEAVGDTASVEQLMPEYEAVMEKIGQIEEEDRQRVGSLIEGDIPPEMDAPYSDGQPTHVEDPFESRDWSNVGKRSVKAYMYENPEVKPFFQEEALNLLDELNSTTRGEKWYNDELYYESGGEKGFGGVKRHTSASMEELLDQWGMSYADIEKGLNAIIEDHGAENIAAAKKLEFMLNDRLLNGYKDFYTNGHVPPNQDYINFLAEKQITEYSKEAFDAFMAHADEYTPPAAEDIAPIADSDIAPVAGTPQVFSEVKTEQKNVQEGQQAMWEGVGKEPKRQTRKELHGSIIDNIKSKFSEKGFDLDNVLKGAKNLSTFATVDNTPQRVMEKALGYKEGQILSDITVNQVAQNETEGTKWLNSFTHRKSGLLAQLSKQYNIKPGSKQSAAAQMYAEGFYVNENNEIIEYGDAELAKDFPDFNVQANIKGLARDPRIRQIYDDTLAMINESRTRNAYPEIPRLDNYFLHFRAMDDTFSRLGLPFNPNDIRAKDLPTDLNGVTADLKPGQPYFASAMHRKGMRTSFDLLGGLERYLTSAKNQIYHIDDIQTLRALRNYIADTYGQANGLEGLDALSEEEAQERIEKVYSSHLSTFAKFLNEEANVLAGKTALIDRGLEGILGRRGMTFLDTVNKQVGSNMVGFNISSSLTNFLPVAQTFAKTNKADFVKAFGQTVGNKIGSVFGKTDGFTENSPVVIRRKGADRFYRTPFQKVGDAGYVFMSAVDDISTELIARTKYNELIRKGMDSQKAHYETDKWVSRLMGDRSLGQMPQLYNSKMLGLITKFQLEVRNQLDSQFYDTIQEAKVSNEHIQNGLARNAKTAAKVTSTFVQLAVAQHLFGKAFESVAGYNPAFDIIEVIMTAFGFDDEEESEDTVLDNIEQGFLAMLEDMPYTSTFTGGRIPISSALPIKEFVTGKDDYGTDKPRLETLGEVAPYYVLPGGYGQIKKTVQGLKMFSDEHPVTGSYTDKGDLRFPVDDTFVNRVQAGVFGQYASENARKYFDNNIAPLNEKQVQEYATLGLSYDEYWAYRDDMSTISKRADVEGASDEDVVKSKYISSIDSKLSAIQAEKESIMDDAGINAAEKSKRVSELERQFDDLVNERYNSYNHVSLDGDYAKIGSSYYQWYTPETGDPYWRKLTDSQVTKYTLTKNAGNAHYVTDGSVHYRRDQDGEWTKISDKQLERQREVTKALGITPEEYWSKTDISFMPRSEGEYEYAFEHPDNYAVAKAVGGYDAYKGYSKDLSDIKADKDKNGKSISGSRKEKVLDYINNLDADYGEKIILLKSEYPSDDTYNYEIIDYLNSREDISYSEMATILKELGFNVSSDGNITWD